jgi:hypothetical protein
MQFIDSAVVSQTAIPTAAPTGNVGIDLSIAYPQNIMRESKWLVTAVVTGAPSDLFVWGAGMVGNLDDSTDDRWGFHNDKYGRVLNGKLGSALAIGTHHFVVTDIAIYTRLYFQRSAGAVDVFISPIIESKKSS